MKDKASRCGVEFKLLDAVIQVESSYNIYAVRFEPRSISQVIPAKFANINMTTEDTEQMLQKFSWGLCQIMGSTARWLGYQGPLPYLCDVETNLLWACRFLSKLKDEHGTIENTIAAYNRGSIKRLKDGTLINQGYVDKVLEFYNKP